MVKCALAPTSMKCLLQKSLWDLSETSACGSAAGDEDHDPPPGSRRDEEQLAFGVVEPRPHDNHFCFGLSFRASPQLRGDRLFRRAWSLLFGLLAFGDILLAQAGFEITPEVDQLIRSGSKDMYSFEMDEADKKFDELIHRFPDHPVGYMYRAEVIWWKALRDTKNKGLEEAFKRFTAEAIAKGKANLSKNGSDFYALVYLASAYGNETRYYVYVDKSYLRAMRSGMKGYRYIKTAYAQRKDYVDCLIGIGTYNYFTGALPFLMKPFAWMVGGRGNKNEGIKQLELASQTGRYGQVEAKTVLLGVYFNEERFDEYEKLLTDLIYEFPPNPVFYMWMADFFVTRKKLDEGIQFFAGLIKTDHGSSETRLSLEYANYEKGRLELEKKKLGRLRLQPEPCH